MRAEAATRAQRLAVTEIAAARAAEVAAEVAAAAREAADATAYLCGGAETDAGREAEGFGPHGGKRQLRGAGGRAEG